VILHTTDQAATAAKDHIAAADFAFNHDFGERLHAADGSNFGAVYIAQRQMKKQILNRIEAKLLQFGRQQRADSAKLFDADTM
jgi:hypothetical protein